MLDMGKSSSKNANISIEPRCHRPHPTGSQVTVGGGKVPYGVAGCLCLSSHPPARVLRKRGALLRSSVVLIFWY